MKKKKENKFFRNLCTEETITKNIYEIERLNLQHKTI